MTTEVIVGVIAFGTAVVGLATAYLSRIRHVVHRHELPEPREPERSPSRGVPEIDLELVATEPLPHETAGGSMPARPVARESEIGTRDGLNSSILPNARGASGGKGLPPRTHAIHKILFDARSPLPLDEIERRLSAWGYGQETVSVTRNHLRSLCEGWGKDKVVAVAQDAQGRYALTREGRDRLAAGPFSDALP